MKLSISAQIANFQLDRNPNYEARTAKGSITSKKKNNNNKKIKALPVNMNRCKLRWWKQWHFFLSGHQICMSYILRNPTMYLRTWKLFLDLELCPEYVPVTHWQHSAESTTTVLTNFYFPLLFSS